MNLLKSPLVSARVKTLERSPSRPLRRPGAILAAFLAALAACTTQGGAEPGLERSASDKPPNVLIFLTDDQRTSTMTAMDKTRRWFEDGGRRYANAYATTPLCCPFRASLFSGRFAHNHGVHLNSDPLKLDQRATLQRYLRDAGYRTGITGKFLNFWPLERTPPNFDHWAIFSPPGSGRAYYDVPFNTDGRVRTIGNYSTSYISDQAARILDEFEEQDQRPWLLYVTPYAPHTPMTPRPEDAGAAVGRWLGNPAVEEEDRSDKPPYVQDQSHSLEAGRKLRARQIRVLLPVDDLVDRLMTKLADLDEDRDTLAFYLSDNGYLWGEHGMTRKNVPYTDSVKIPFYVRWPGRVDGGVVNRDLVTNIDIAPTILDLAGLPKSLRSSMDGRPFIEGMQRRRVHLESWSGSSNGSVLRWASTRTKRYQYVEYYARGSGGPEFRELYDLREDPWQLTNLLGDDDAGNDPGAGLLRRLHRRLAEDLRCAGSACP